MSWKSRNPPGIKKKERPCPAVPSATTAILKEGAQGAPSTGQTSSEDLYAQYVLTQFQPQSTTTKATSMTQQDPSGSSKTSVNPSRRDNWNDLQFWNSSDWRRLSSELRQEGDNVLPNMSHVFRPFLLTPLHKVKVMIVASEPYALRGANDGLAYSHSEKIEDERDLPTKLQAIFLEAMNDVGIPKPTTGSLRAWAKQGVLLWNGAPTVLKNRPFSHQTKGWDVLTKEVIDTVYLQNPNTVFVFWESRSLYFSERLPPDARVIKSPFLGVGTAYSGFYGSKPFSRINTALQNTRQGPINWAVH